MGWGPPGLQTRIAVHLGVDVFILLAIGNAILIHGKAIGNRMHATSSPATLFGGVGANLIVFGFAVAECLVLPSVLI